jgi:hypothetical protein
MDLRSYCTYFSEIELTSLGSRVHLLKTFKDHRVNSTPNG